MRRGPTTPKHHKAAAAAVLLPLAALLAGCMGRSDSMAPVIAITDPRSGATRSTEDLRISGYAMDDKGVASIRVGGLDLLQAELYAADPAHGQATFAHT